MKKMFLLGMIAAAILTGCGGGAGSVDAVENYTAVADTVENVVDQRDIEISWALQKYIDAYNEKRAEGWVLDPVTGERTAYQEPISIYKEISNALQEVINETPITSENDTYTKFGLMLGKQDVSELAEKVKSRIKNDYTPDVLISLKFGASFGDGSDIDSWVENSFENIAYSHFGENLVCGIANFPDTLQAEEHDGVIEDQGQIVLCWSDKYTEN